MFLFGHTYNLLIIARDLLLTNPLLGIIECFFFFDILPI